MAAIESHLEAKRLVEKYGHEAAVGIARQRSLHALDMAGGLLSEGRTVYWKAQFSFWDEVKEAIKSVK